MDYNDEDSFANHCEKINLNQEESGNLSPIHKTRGSELSVADSKNEQLFRLRKELDSRRSEMHQKAFLVKENLKLEYCTFTPRINIFRKNVFDESTVHKEAFNSYVERVTKHRESKKAWDDQIKHMTGSGKKWKKAITLSDGVSSKPFSSPLKSKQKRMPSLNYDTHLDVIFFKN